ncbi:MAG: ABC transporter permease [Bifidobacteriaceae bacterium]|jgi:ABC-2 type transport system permease protein|nr:ABC transporter permease [Bifidobacteriaceae bacterium]
MNVYLFEFRRQWRSFLAGTLTQAIVAAVFLGGMYPMYHDSQKDVEKVLAGFPPRFAAAFGITKDMFSFGGFFAFIYVYLAIVAAIFGALWGLKVFGREKLDRCMDFLISKPASRMGLFWQKALVVLTGIVVMNGVFLGVALWVRTSVGATSPGVGQFVLMALAVGGVQLIFAALGALIAVLAPRLHSVTGLGVGLGILGFVLSALPPMTNESNFKAISPFSYFNVSQMQTQGTYETGYLVTAGALCVVALAVACVAYVRSDVKA